MSKKCHSYSSIKEWTEKRAAKGADISGVGRALAAYEALKQEIKELGAKLEEKRKARPEAFEALAGEFKKAKAAVKKVESEERKAAKKAKKAGKAASSGLQA